MITFILYMYIKYHLKNNMNIYPIKEKRSIIMINNKVIVTGKNIHYPVKCYKKDLKKLIKKYKGTGNVEHPSIFVHNGVK